MKTPPTPTRPEPRSQPLHRGPAWLVLRVLAVLLLLGGLVMAVLGTWLVTLGGSPYFVAAGVLMMVAAALVLARRAAAGVMLYAAVVVATLLWSLWEIHSKGWMPVWGVDLSSRVGVLLGLLLLMVLALLLMPRPTRPASASHTRSGPVMAGVALLGLALALPVGLTRWTPAQAQPSTPAVAAPPINGDLSVPALSAVGQASTRPVLGRAAASPGADEWTAYGGSNLGQRYAQATQITRENVDQLEPVWNFRTGDMAPNERVFFAFQNTPQKIGDSLFVCSSSGQVFALHPATGAQQWHFNPAVPLEAMGPLFSVACRAVAYHETPVVATPDGDPAGAAGRATAAAECPRRILLATVDSRLIALDATTGKPCPGFGNGGTVDLGEGMGNQAPGLSSNTSGPVVVGDRVIVGQQVSDNQRRDAPSGVVRAYDVRTGAFSWAWDAKRTDRPRQPLGLGEIWPRGTPNVWTVISADESLGLVYLPTGNSANDHYGADRSAEEDRYTAAVVAVEAATGQVRWHYSTVDHDLWDYDLGAQPTLMDMEIDGRMRRVLLQGTKTGSIFVLDAATGEPLRPVENRSVPQGATPGDRTAPTQPQSVALPNFAGAPQPPGAEPERLTEAHMFGLTPIDALMCRIKFRQMRYEGIYTPPTEAAGGMLLFPGTIGGLNWGGLAVNPDLQILITNHSRLPNVVTLIPRAQVTDQAVGSGGQRVDQKVAPHAGSPYGVTRPIWLSMFGVPCIAPPWGYLAATDLRTGQLLWSQPLGTGYDSGPLGIPTRLKITLGTTNIGGAVNTASGLTFIAAAQDNFLRAFDTRTGKLLWEARLPAGGQASPMTYMHEGRQYVAIAAGGHARLKTTLGDHLVVYALPR
ncbi:membrane-bound PQQ-dependent dehydrogenase, glucose/quinate/shikimate family [Hydrogenophaga sp.]|uniref:membrane-bound PQQ-dependent dehydrogenase, glucose/quinate/shikimate family n=1 Tax=Hydrogenophaga sp. TaxID=1904254 RepID=UPI0025C2FF83|nr:membrane-bound PQQ-dependent dehydrogenase, glucose/quinate/shikimate family [Hydrogenophaga sp.]